MIDPDPAPEGTKDQSLLQRCVMPAGCLDQPAKDQLLETDPDDARSGDINFK